MSHQNIQVFFPPNAHIHSKFSHSFPQSASQSCVNVSSNLESLLYYIKKEEYNKKLVVKMFNLLTFYKIVIDYKNTRAESQGFQVKKNPFGVFLRMNSCEIRYL